MKSIKIRLLIKDIKLEENNNITISDNNFSYLTKVMRQKIGDKIAIFNGQGPEFAAIITQIDKKSLTLNIKEEICPFKKLNNITLAFAPVKNAKNELIASKSCELGIKNFQPIITKHSIVDKINYEKFNLYIKEACEQCERNDIAQIYPIKTLNDFLKEENFKNKIVIFCDESKKGQKISQILKELNEKEDLTKKEIVILTGPEGGFSQEEFQKLYQFDNIYSASLGKQILRADTAIICAISLLQDCLN